MYAAASIVICASLLADQWRVPERQRISYASRPGKGLAGSGVTERACQSRKLQRCVTPSSLRLIYELNGSKLAS